MEGIITDVDERKEVYRKMPSKRVKPGNRGCWGYPSAAFPASPASSDRKSESSTNSMEAVPKNYGEQWGHAGEESPLRNRICPDKMSVGFRLGEMSPGLDMSSDGGRSSEGGRITPRNNFGNCLNSMPGEPFLEAEISNGHSESLATPMKEEAPSSSPNFSPREGYSLNDLMQAKQKSKTHRSIFNPNERRKWTSPTRLLPEGISKTSCKRNFQPEKAMPSSVHCFYAQPYSDWKESTKNSRVASKLNVMSTAIVKVDFPPQNNCSMLCHRNIYECQDYGGKCARVDSSKKVEELLSSWEVFIHKLKNCEQTPTDVVEAIEEYLRLTKEKIGEYCSDKEISLWPKTVKDPTDEASYEVHEQEGSLASVIPFQAPSKENRDLPSHDVPDGDSSEMKFNDSDDVERNNSFVKLVKGEHFQNFKDVNEDKTFPKDVDSRKDHPLRWQNRRESTIKETNESLTPVFKSQVENLSPEESSEHGLANAGSNYSLMIDSSYSGKHVFSQRVGEGEVQDYCHQDVRNSQAGRSPCNQSQMFVNPNRNEYCTIQIKAEASPKQEKGKNPEYNSAPESNYSACQERPAREALEAADCNLATKDESLISDTLKPSQNPPPFNPDFVRSQHVDETGHYKHALGYKYMPAYEHPSYYHDPRYYQPYCYPSQDRYPYGMYNVYEHRGRQRLSLPFQKPYQQPFPHLNNTSIRTYQ